jgi:hypothetical protein
MKTILLAISITVLATLSLVGSATAQGSGISFQVSNQQAELLGQVTVSTVDGNFYLVVPGNSSDTVTIADTAISLTIEGQVVPQGVNAFVTLQDGKVVEVLWATPCNVVVIDTGEIE